MRADRLVAILLLLQARGRLSAGELAAELEVSLKTARRDLEALAMAGVPVYSQPGRNGGWSLLGGARTDLSGLTAAEARALFLVAGPSASVAPDARSALRKLVRALPETFRADAQAAASAVVLDPARWGGTPPEQPAPPQLATLQAAIIDGRRVRLGYVDRRGAETERTVDPLGLAHKGASWYLVAGTPDGQRTFLVWRIRSVVPLDEKAVRPEGFDLETAWASVVAEMEERRRRVRARVRIAPGTLAPLRSQFGADLRVLDESVVEIGGAAPDRIAEQLAGWGRLVEVLEPESVRAELARIGAELAARYRPRPVRSTGE